jgi:hypothetical protein
MAANPGETGTGNDLLTRRRGVTSARGGRPDLPSLICLHSHSAWPGKGANSLLWDCKVTPVYWACQEGTTIYCNLFYCRPPFGNPLAVNQGRLPTVRHPAQERHGARELTKPKCPGRDRCGGQIQGDLTAGSPLPSLVRWPVPSRHRYLRRCAGEQCVVCRRTIRRDSLLYHPGARGPGRRQTRGVQSVGGREPENGCGIPAIGLKLSSHDPAFGGGRMDFVISAQYSGCSGHAYRSNHPTR